MKERSVGAAAAVHLAACGRLPRNGIVGIRTTTVRRDDNAWIRGHRAAVLPTWATAGVVVGLAAASIPQGDDGSVVLTSIAVAVLLAGALLGTVLANRAARSECRR